MVGTSHDDRTPANTASRRKMHASSFQLEASKRLEELPPKRRREAQVALAQRTAVIARGWTIEQADVVPDLLRACGEVRKLQFPTLPRSGRKATCCVCVFRDLLGVARACAALDGFPLGNVRVSVRPNTSTMRAVALEGGKVNAMAQAAKDALRNHLKNLSKQYSSDVASKDGGTSPTIQVVDSSVSKGIATGKDEGTEREPDAREEPHGQESVAHQAEAFLRSMTDSVRGLETGPTKPDASEPGEIEPSEASPGPSSLAKGHEMPSSSSEKKGKDSGRAEPISLGFRWSLPKQPTVVSKTKPVLLIQDEEDEEEGVDDTRMNKRSRIVPSSEGTSERNGGPSPLSEEELKALIAEIPTEAAQVFGMEMDWKAYDLENVSNVVRSWLMKKTRDLLGTEDSELVDCLISHLDEHCQPEAIVRELEPILEEESETFVLKLWRMLIFEIRKASSSRRRD